MIKLIITDVDGTLTDSSVIYSDKNIETKAFSTKDGAILKVLPQMGINVVFLTGRESEATVRRAKDLNAVSIQGVDNKALMFDRLLSDYDVSPDEVAYFGDDLNDIKIMLMCGLKCCPADATREIIDICDFVSAKNGGYGAVRECCEHILRHDGKYEAFINMWME